MNDAALSGFSGIARLFPLPGLVLFPHVIQGLHIFETRYRQMIADALADDGLIALVMLKSDSEDTSEQTEIEEVGCLGTIIWHEQLPDGRYNLRLRGICRARIVHELESDRLYRTAQVEMLNDNSTSDLAELMRLRKELAAAVLPQFADDSPARQQLQELFAGELTLGHICDILSYALPLPVEFKQSLLAEPCAARRAAAITDTLNVSAARADRPFPPLFSAN